MVREGASVIGGSTSVGSFVPAVGNGEEVGRTPLGVGVGNDEGDFDTVGLRVGFFVVGDEEGVVEGETVENVLVGNALGTGPSVEFVALAVGR
jgi:hypothetical protein